MFGIFRYFLSIMVVIGHLWPGLMSWSGHFAVYSFFMLSGYLMSFVLHNVYGFTYKKIPRYLINRLLRIYPPYFLVLFLSFAISAYYADIAAEINTALKDPSTVMAWLHNIFIFGLYSESIRLIPPAWSLDIELCFYILVILLTRNRIIVALWMICSIGSVGYLQYYTNTLEYGSFYQASLCFSIGAFIFHFKDHSFFCIVNSINYRKYNILVSTLLYFINLVFIKKALFSILITVYVINSLRNISTNGINTKIKKLDKFLGDLSYPIFLCHWTMAVVSIAFFSRYGVSLSRLDGSLFFSSLIFAHIVAYATNSLIEKPVNRIRDLIRDIK